MRRIFTQATLMTVCAALSLFLSSPASAQKGGILKIPGGSIWSDSEAKRECPVVASRWLDQNPGWLARWTGRWFRTDSLRESLCEIRAVPADGPNSQPFSDGNRVKNTPACSGIIKDAIRALDQKDCFSDSLSGPSFPNFPSIFGFSFAPDTDPTTKPKKMKISAGPIWNDGHAQTRCPEVTDGWMRKNPDWNARWNGQWVTTVMGQESVCEIIITPRDRFR